MEVLICVLWELLEEKSEEGVNVFTSSDGVVHRATAVGKAGVNRLVQEDDGGIRIPRVGVVNDITIFVNGSRAQFEEQAR